MRLGAPGAGLPWPERWIAPVIFHLAYRRTPPPEIARLLRREAEILVELAGQFTEEEGARPVLIRRLRGMEDSSRNWSVFMTFAHVAIVNEQVAGVISALGRGEVPPGRASTATVKPDHSAGPEAVDRFVASTGAIRAAAVGSGASRAPYGHPWFGPLDASQWHFMAGFHQRLHRGQILAIGRTLGCASHPA